MPNNAPLPMIAPDGTPGFVDQSAIQQAASMGYKPAIQLRAPNGDKGIVALTDLGQARNAGYRTEGEYLDSQHPSPTPQNNDAGLLSTPLRFAKGAGNVLANAATGLYHTVADDPQTPGENRAAMLGPLGLISYRMGLEPQIATGKQAVQDLKSGNTTQGLGRALASIIPMAGPAAAQTGIQLGNYIGSGDYAGAAGNLAGNAAMIYLGNKAMGKIAGTPNVPGQNYTPTQLSAHAGLLGRATGMGDNFIPQQAASDTLSTIRQAAADNPAIAQTARTGGNSPQNIAAFQSILQKANTALEAPHAGTIAQHASVPADVSAIQSAVQSQLPKTLQGVAPEDAAALQELSNRLGTVQTLGGLNDLRQWLNNEAADSYKMDNIAANRSGVVKSAYRSAADAARDSYFDQLQNASGQDFQPIKRIQSALMSQQEASAGMGQKLSSQQAIADEPKNLGARGADVLTGGRSLKAGPVAGAGQLLAEKVFGQKPLTQPNYLIRKLLEDLPPPSSSTGVPPPGQMVRQLPPPPMPQIPAQSSGAYAMPGHVPFSPGMSSGEQVAALMQYLRSRYPAALPEKAAPIRLGDGK